MKIVNMPTIKAYDLEKALIEKNIIDKSDDVRQILFYDDFANDCYKEFSSDAIEDAMDDFDYYIKQENYESAKEVEKKYRIACFIQEELKLDSVLIDVSW